MTLGYLDPITCYLFTSKFILVPGVIVQLQYFYILLLMKATKTWFKNTMLNLLLITLPYSVYFARAYYVIFR